MDAMKKLRKKIYGLYKEDWMFEHGIDDEAVIKASNNYIELVKAGEFSGSFEDYLDEFGFNNELYVSYEEFLDNEYKDTEYMVTLLMENGYYRKVDKYLSDIVKDSDEMTVHGDSIAYKVYNLHKKFTDDQVTFEKFMDEYYTNEDYILSLFLKANYDASKDYADYMEDIDENF
jgi:hypothetical protein